MITMSDREVANKAQEIETLSRELSAAKQLISEIGAGKDGKTADSKRCSLNRCVVQ